MMDINELTIGQVKEIQRMGSVLGSDETVEKSLPSVHPYELGKVYFIRTVTFYYVGRLTGITPNELVLEQAAWIADTGRFSDALKVSEFKEVEPFPVDQPVIIGRGSVVDATEICVELPLIQK